MLDFVYFGMIALLATVGTVAYFWSSRNESVPTLKFMIVVCGMLAALFGAFWVTLFVITAGPVGDYVANIVALVFTFLALLVVFLMVGFLWFTRSKAVVFLKGAAVVATVSLALVGVFWVGTLNAITPFV